MSSIWPTAPKAQLASVELICGHSKLQHESAVSLARDCLWGWPLPSCCNKQQQNNNHNTMSHNGSSPHQFLWPTVQVIMNDSPTLSLKLVKFHCSLRFRFIITWHWKYTRVHNIILLILFCDLPSYFTKLVLNIILLEMISIHSNKTCYICNGTWLRFV